MYTETRVIKILYSLPTILRQLHTCDTFLNPNREIWNFWSGNLCLVSGGFHVANFGLFFTEVKVAKSNDIARNMLPSITMITYMPTEVRKCVRLQFKKPLLILF